MSRLTRLWRTRRAAALAVCVAVGGGFVIAVIWPVTDLIAAHDVGRLSGLSRTFHLQAAREAVRAQLLTLGAGVFAAGALIYTARNFRLAQRQLGLARQTMELTAQGQVTDRFTKAIDQLGSDKPDVRVGGVYALERVARDSARDHQARHPGRYYRDRSPGCQTRPA